MISMLQHAYNINDAVGRGLQSAEASFLTLFVYTFTGANYGDIAYDTGSDEHFLYSIFFLVIIFVGVFLFLSILLSVFQSEFSQRINRKEEACLNERQEGHHLAFRVLRMGSKSQFLGRC